MKTKKQARNLRNMKKMKNVKNMKNVSNVKKAKKIQKVKASNELDISPKLFVSGRLDRKKDIYSAKSLILLKKLEEAVKMYTRGGDVAVLNYLVREGLRCVKASKNTIHVDMADLEKDPI